MLKLYNNKLIGYCETGVSEFGLYGQDTSNVFNSNIKSQSSSWKYHTTKVFYNRNSTGHRSKEIKDLSSEYFLFIGCSITVGSAVALEETFPYIVAKHANKDYYNLAVEGAGYDMIAYNLSNWFKQTNIKPRAVIIKWPELFRTFRIHNNTVIPIGPWNCKADIGSAVTTEEWAGFEVVSSTDYFKHYSSIIKDTVESLITSHGITIINVPDLLTMDLGRDLKHPGTETHKALASSILNILGQ
jgi:hypothetical protein